MDTPGLMAERAEAVAWRDVWRACPGPLAAGLGLEMQEIGDALCLVSSRIDAAEFNRALGLGLSAPAGEDTLDEIVAFYRPFARASARLQLSPLAQPHDRLTAGIERRGLMRSPLDWAKVGRRTDAPIPAAETALTVVEAGPAEAAAFGAAVCGGFGMPEVLQPWLGALVGRPDWRCYVAFEGEAPAAGAALHLGEGWGWLGMGAALADHRRRGAQGALMARRIADAAKAGKAWAFTETGAPTPDNPDQPSYRNMIRFGFSELHRRPNYVL